MSLLSLVTPMGAATGTGMVKIVSQLQSSLHGASDGPLVQSVLADLPSLFGDYPSHTDIAPSAVFVAVFSLLSLGHLFVFVKNWTRGHRFYFSFGLAVYCFLRVLGFGLRINWAQSVLRVNTGIASTVFSLVSVLYLNMMNMRLGHRIFTWRHPETGDSMWYNIIMFFIYFFVIGIIVMAICGQAIPYTFFLSESHFEMCKKVTRAAAVMEMFYALAGIFLIVIAFLIPAGRVDHRFGKWSKSKDVLPPTHQPTWIESTGLFYYPQRGSQRQVYKNQPLAKAIRLIPSKVPPASGLSEMQHEPHHSGPRIRVAIGLIVVTSLILAVNCGFRLASTFIDKPRGGANGVPFASWVFRPYIFYIFYGAFEAIVNVLYLVFRVDLRFYIPDMPMRGEGPVDNAGNSIDNYNTEQDAEATNFGAGVGSDSEKETVTSA